MFGIVGEFYVLECVWVCVCVLCVCISLCVCYSVSKAPLTIKSRWDESVFRVRLFVKICV